MAALREDAGEDKENRAAGLGATLNLEILQIIKDSQQQHGLRHEDYQRYRGYCSRRLRRLRKALGFKMGNRHKFTGKKVTAEILSDNRYLLLVLMDAERAWSYAMQLKQEANTEPRKRFHLFSRLRKAVKHAEELERLCESNRVDAKTKLEAQAYTAYLTGMLSFELQEWKGAMKALHKCKTIYEKLASAFTDEQAVLYHQRVEEISPNIRYCDYNIGDQSAMKELMQMRLRSGESGGLLDTLITQTRAKQAATMSEVEWRGRVIPVKIDKVRIFLLGLADNEASIAQTTTDEAAKERLYESLLSECRDAIQAVREELRVDPVQKQRERSLEPDSGKVSILQYLHSYLTYIKLSTAIKRNVSMAEALQKQLSEPTQDEGKRVLRPQDLIRLYDIILQNLSELPQLSGLEDDKNFQMEVELKTLVYKAYRCFFIAQSYVLVKKWSEALVLYERVLKYTSEAQAQTTKFTNNLQDLPDVKELAARVNAEKYSVQAAAILDTEDISEMVSQLQVKDNKPLRECLDVFRIEPSLVTKHANLVRFPPDFQPIPCKPLFFDLALNHAAFPPLEDKVEQKGKGGLTGYIKGFFGFRG
ncbi:signal recognition particle subunit SRP68 [Heptranchias perlo]|uniref:signal recognition particle subunit SRP68 n=1 Tax=Heptranchias perlo TaxID=212740 RepID=UPI003559731C